MENISQVNELALQKALCCYLDKSGHLTQLLQSGKSYLMHLWYEKQRGALGLPFYFYPVLDLPMITQLSGDLGSLICREPALAEAVLHTVTLTSLRELDNLTGNPTFINRELVNVSLRVSGLPWDGEVSTPRCEQRGLRTVRGVLCAFTTTAKYIRSCVSRCSMKHCPGGSRRLRGGWIAGRHCFQCGVETAEVPAEREEGEEIRALLMPLQQQGDFQRTQPVLVLFRDDLVPDLVLGEHYEVVCRPLLQRRTSACSLIACSIPKHCLGSLSLEQPHLGGLPPALAAARDRLGDASGALVMALATQVARTELPPNTFLHLRIATLLSLASQGSTRPVPLLMCGAEHEIASRLLQAASRLSPRRVMHGALGPVSALARQDPCEGQTWLEAGSLLLATGGVCLLGDWQGLKKDVKGVVLASIESGRVTLQLPSRPHAVPLRGAVWTHCDRLPMKFLRPIIDVFGLPWLAETSEAEDAALCDWLLDTSVHGSNPLNQSTTLYIPDQEIKELVILTGMRDVGMTSEASRLIRDYFVASRRARAGGICSVEECLPIGAMQTMTALAEAHARLSLSTEVGVADAVAVIVLYEHTMTALFGPSVIPPPQPFTSIDPNTPLDLQVTSYLQSALNWLQRFISALLGDQF